MIAIVSLACRYPDASTPDALWANVLEGRRSFRPMPQQRLPLVDYEAERIGGVDAITPIRVGLLENWSFDRERFRIPKSTFDSVDLVHWLALDVASEAIEYAGGRGRLDPERTGIVVANTLTGEFSRAAMMRLRLPFLDTVLAQALDEIDLDESTGARVRARFATALKSRFTEPDEEMLAGALANTIAGRIANAFDLHGGAYAVDAACASSLVALANAASALVSGSLDAVLVTAVDLSLDPFELVGFSRNGALARDEMLVFDAHSNGFWPGEGAAAVLLMRQEDAHRAKLPTLATLRGWGLSSDGRGGLTRPDTGGQLRALKRAYALAGIDPRAVGYVEAHGTGTTVGDSVEVRALAALRIGAETPLLIGSIKANIGHTKAAAGLAGLVKMVKALEAGMVPPHVGCHEPHPIFAEVNHLVRPALEPLMWRKSAEPLAGISSFGFGGINAHIVIEGPAHFTRTPVRVFPPRHQDAELFLLAGENVETVVREIDRILSRAETMNPSELVDAAAAAGAQACKATHPGALRVSIVARDGQALAAKLAVARDKLLGGRDTLDSHDSVFIGTPIGTPRLGFLFSGQAAPSRPDGGLWARRFDAAHEFASRIPKPAGNNTVDTAIAQPAIVAASIAGLELLRRSGLEADAALGHSLGELTALAWAEAIAERDLIALACGRGSVMHEHGLAGGGMMRVGISPDATRRLVSELDLVVACMNAPSETVLAGPLAELVALELRALAAGIEATRLSVSHAFHSPMMEPAARAYAAILTGIRFGALRHRVHSTISGEPLEASVDLAGLLIKQFTAPVLFSKSLARLITETDLLIEVGPGSGLTRLARVAGARAATIDAFGPSLVPLLESLGLAFTMGASVDLAPLFADRTTRPIDWAVPSFLKSPCGRPGGQANLSAIPPSPPLPSVQSPVSLDEGSDPLEIVRNLVAAETGFALRELGEADRFLDDLHLNSLSVARIVARAAKAFGVSLPRAPTEFANATLGMLAAELSGRRAIPLAEDQGDGPPAGVRHWVRTYRMNWREAPVVESDGNHISWSLVPIAISSDEQLPVLPETTHHDARCGVLIWLGDAADERANIALFECCQKAWQDQEINFLAICHAGLPVSAFARSLAAEHRFSAIKLIERPVGVDVSWKVIATLAETGRSFLERRITADERRLAPVFEPMEPELQDSRALNSTDVVLVTGGARGIGAECAARLARHTGAALMLVGRSDASHPEVVLALQRLSASGVRYRYLAVDATDAAALAAAVEAAAGDLGPVTALLHAAGINDPKPFAALTTEDLERTLAPKIAGFRAAIVAAGPTLRKIVTFGSIIGRLGLAGEAHYALANAWQTELGERLAVVRPELAVLALEWSVWSGTGMGERTGTIDRLAAEGVEALSVDEALDAFERLALGTATGACVVTSRFGPPQFVNLGNVELPILRFVDRPLVHYPGVELVLETTLSPGRDPYLLDHRFNDAMILPGVMALEAMAHAAFALTGKRRPSAIEAVSFEEAVIVPERQDLQLRIAALSVGDNRIEVVVRAGDDDFAHNRARATFVFGDQSETTNASTRPSLGPACEAGPLYGTLFFHKGRFCRLSRYSTVSARHIIAEIEPAAGDFWFGSFESQDLILSDPGARDAALHALQAAVPHKRVLPIGIRRILHHSRDSIASVHAREVDASDDTYTFDLTLRDAEEGIVEEWLGVRFRAVDNIEIGPVLGTTSALMGAYVERTARVALRDPSIEVAMVVDPDLSRETRRYRAIASLGLTGRVGRRHDGKPEISALGNPVGLSLAHHNHITLAVTAYGSIGCDLESIDAFFDEGAPSRLPQALRRLATNIATKAEMSWPEAAASAWTANEALFKAGVRQGLHGISPLKKTNGMLLTTNNADVLTLGPFGGTASAFILAVTKNREASMSSINYVDNSTTLMAHQ